MARSGGRHLGPMLGVALATAAASLLAGTTGALDRLDADTVDLRFELRGERPTHDVLVVAIDDRTFSELGERWPFPRSLHARAIDRLRAAGARQIAYDVQFTEASDPRQDTLLADAVARTPHVVLSTTEVDDRGRTNVLGGDDVLSDMGARAGNTSVATDAGGVVRRLLPSIDGLESFAVATVEAATGRQVEPSSFGTDGSPIDFHGPPGTIETLSFSRLLQGKFDRGSIRGRIVVVGASAPSLQDVHPTSSSGSELMSGPEVQANAISTVLRGLPLRRAPFWLDALAIVLLAFAVPLASLRLAPLGAALGALVALGTYAAVAVLAFDGGLALAVAAPALALVLGSLGALSVRLVAESRERRRTRELFGRFVPEAVLEELLDGPGAGRRLPGTRLEATVLFCDLRGFTAFAERVGAERVLEVLNRYLTEMSEAILERGGTVVSYMGDGVMAVFGSPLERPDHARAAFGAARDMLEVRLPRLNAWLREEGLPEFELGIGLNSGPVMSGTVGSERRLEYAAIGDTTNVAARLEQMTKDTGDGLLVADSTRAGLDVEGAGLVMRGELPMRGRGKPVIVWACPRALPTR